MADDLRTLAAYSAALEKIAFALPDWSAVGTTTAATCTATATAPGEAFQRVADKAVVSFSAAPAGVLAFTLSDDTTVIFRCEIPAAATAPIVIPLRGLRAARNKALTASVGSAGGSTVQSITLTGWTIKAP